MKKSKDKKGSIYDISNEIKGEREEIKPINNIRKVNPYVINKKTERRRKTQRKSECEKAISTQ